MGWPRGISAAAVAIVVAAGFLPYPSAEEEGPRQKGIVFASAAAAATCAPHLVTIAFSDGCYCPDYTTYGPNCNTPIPELCTTGFVSSEGICFDMWGCWPSGLEGTQRMTCCPSTGIVACSGQGSCIGWGTSAPYCVCNRGQGGPKCRRLTLTKHIITKTHTQTVSRSLSRSSTQTLSLSSSLTTTVSVSRTHSRTVNFITASRPLTGGTATLTRSVTRTLSASASRSSSSSLTVRKTVSKTPFKTQCFLPDEAAVGRETVAAAVRQLRAQTNNQQQQSSSSNGIARTPTTIRMQRYVATARTDWGPSAALQAAFLIGFVFATLVSALPAVHPLESAANGFWRLFFCLPYTCLPYRYLSADSFSVGDLRRGKKKANAYKAGNASASGPSVAAAAAAAEEEGYADFLAEEGGGGGNLLSAYAHYQSAEAAAFPNAVHYVVGEMRIEAAEAARAAAEARQAEEALEAAAAERRMRRRDERRRVRRQANKAEKARLRGLMEDDDDDDAYYEEEGWDDEEDEDAGGYAEGQYMY